METFKPGDMVTVTHDMGTETGVVVGATRGTDCPQVTVRFNDGTISSWSTRRVVRTEAVK